MYMAEYYGNICTCRKCNGIVHTIKRGDTLYLLSRYYNVTINEIMRANANINVYNLQIGDQICIPVRRPTPEPGRPGMGMNPPPESGRPGTGMNPPLEPGRPGMGMNPPSQRPGTPVIPPMIQPRDDEDRDNRLDDLIEDLLEGENNQNRMQSDNMRGNNMGADVMAVSESEAVEASCCGSMKVKDVLKDDNMTLEELARMLKSV